MPVTSVKVSTIWSQLRISSYMAMTVLRYFSGSRNAAATAQGENRWVSLPAICVPAIRAPECAMSRKLQAMHGRFRQHAAINPMHLMPSEFCHQNRSLWGQRENAPTGPVAVIGLIHGKRASPRMAIAKVSTPSSPFLPQRSAL